MKIPRRDFIAMLGGAAAEWPRMVCAQAVPVIGFLGSTQAGPLEFRVASFRQGLKETGYIEGRNLTIEYRWAEDQYDRLPALVAELVRRQVAVIAAASVASALAVRNSTAAIPMVFMVGGDPVDLGLVASLNKPGGTVTGVNFLSNLLAAKQLELLLELVPNATIVGLLVDPNYSATEVVTRDVQAAADALGKKLVIVKAGKESDIEPAFATLLQQRVTAVLVHSNAFFNTNTKKLVALAARNSLPTIYGLPEYAAAGGLMSYGASVTDAYRQAGIYVGRILMGDKPADLPVMQSTKVELVINMKTAKALGLTFPITLLGRADEVIE
jgi:putative ABC transport system substrate-binding protein